MDRAKCKLIVLVNWDISHASKKKDLKAPTHSQFRMNDNTQNWRRAQGMLRKDDLQRLLLLRLKNTQKLRQDF